MSDSGTNWYIKGHKRMKSVEWVVWIKVKGLTSLTKLIVIRVMFMLRLMLFVFLAQNLFRIEIKWVTLPYQVPLCLEISIYLPSVLPILGKYLISTRRIYHASYLVIGITSLITLLLKFGVFQEFNIVLINKQINKKSVPNMHCSTCNWITANPGIESSEAQSLIMTSSYSKETLPEVCLPGRKLSEKVQS